MSVHVRGMLVLIEKYNGPYIYTHGFVYQAYTDYTTSALHSGCTGQCDRLFLFSTSLAGTPKMRFFTPFR